MTQQDFIELWEKWGEAGTRQAAEGPINVVFPVQSFYPHLRGLCMEADDGHAHFVIDRRTHG
jgi:hypothetical protein